MMRLNAHTVGSGMRLALIVLILMAPGRLWAATVEMVKDINPAVRKFPKASDPGKFATVGTGAFLGSVAYFSAADPLYGQELWRSDGTVAGTRLVKDINPGVASSNPSLLTEMNGMLYFVVRIEQRGLEAETYSNEYYDTGSGCVYELWKSDGTVNGTVMVKRFCHLILYDYARMAAVNGMLYFAADDGVHGIELWKSDGTANGTMMVTDINPNGGSYPRYIIGYKGQAFFIAPSGVPDHRDQLWKSDGTVAGTVVVDDNAGQVWSSLYFLTVSGSYLYYCHSVTYTIGRSRKFENALMRTDGTVGGNVCVFVRTSDASDHLSISQMMDVDGDLFFVFDRKLFRCNENGSSDELYSDSSSPVVAMARLNGLLYFGIYDEWQGGSLWKSDGTKAGTVEVASPSVFGTVQQFSGEMQAVGGTLYFLMTWRGFYAPAELWKTSGSADNTVRVKSLETNLSSSYPRDMIPLGNRLLFSYPAKGPDGTYLREPWISDGTERGTIVLGAPVSLAVSSQPQGLANLNGTVLFAADDGTHGRELWRADGSAGGAALFKDINAGSAAANPSDLATLGGELYFAADDGTHGAEPWSSDGTSSGTTLVCDIYDYSTYGSNPFDFRMMDGKVFFGAQGHIYTTDGTTTGTMFACNPNPNLDYLYDEASGKLTFGINDGSLFASDGTTTGTMLLKNLTVWQYVDNYYSSVRNWSPSRQYATVGGMTFFSADDTSHGRELWRTDGTTSGTVMVRDINPGYAHANPAHFANLDGVLYFTADDGVHGLELWKSDGTEAGTVMVKDLVPGVGSSYPSMLKAVDGMLYFAASDGRLGLEFWRSDGTGDGTLMIQDLWSGGGSSNPIDFTKLGRWIYFSAADAAHGAELWRAQLPGRPVVNCPRTIAVKDPTRVWWAATDAAERYQVQWDNAPDFKTPLANVEVSSPTLAYTFGTNNGHSGGQTCWFRVRAVNRVGRGDWSNVTSSIMAGDRNGVKAWQLYGE